MRAFRSVLALLLCLLPIQAATFGTVVSNPVGQTGISDIVLDESRNLLYVVNTSASRIEIYRTDINPPAHNTAQYPDIRTDATPLSAALSRDSRYLYVACYDATTIFVIDLQTRTRKTSVALGAKPEGIAVAFDGKVLVSTIGTGNGQDVLISYDPNADASRNLLPVVVTPPAPTPPTLPPPSNRIFLSGRGRLKATRDGRSIIGVNELSNNTRTIFVYDALSNIVLRSRNVSNLSPVISISPDGSKFMAGLVLFDTATLAVLAQQNAANAPFSFPGGGTNNFNLQQNQGGSVFSPDGTHLYTAFNIAPTQNPPAAANSSRFLVNDPDNLLIQLGIQLKENLVGRMEITADGSTIYAMSESGFMVLQLAPTPSRPQGAMSQSPIAMPDTTVMLLANDQCGVTAAMQSANIPIRNVGGGTRMTATAQLLASTNTGTTGLGGNGAGGGGLAGIISILFPPAITGGTNGIGSTTNGVSGTTSTTQTAPQVGLKQAGNNETDMTVKFNPVNSRSLGTVPPHDLLIQSAEAINIPPNVRIFQNFRNAEAKGTIVPVTLGSSNSEGLVDMLVDNARLRLYIANSGMNRVEVFDMKANKLLDPIRVGQLPRTLAFGLDGNTLYVGNTGGESISIVDLNQGVVTGRVKFPPIPFNAAFALITPSIITSTQRGPQIIMSDGTLWKIVGDTAVPRILNTAVFGSARTIAGPVRTMASSSDGRFMLLLAGNGTAYLYSSDVDDYINSRVVASAPIQGYYGPVAAGPNGSYFLVNGYVLNDALTTIGQAPTFTVSGGVATSTDPTGGTGPVPSPGSGIGGGTLPSRNNATSTVSRPVSAVASVGAKTFARFSTPIQLSTNAATTDAGQIELVDIDTMRTIGVAAALEGPLATGTVTTRINTNGRTLATDPAGTTAYVLTNSGISVIPIDRTAATNTPQITNNGIVNTANFQPAVAANTIVSIVGKNLASTAQSSGFPLPTVLGGTCVTLNSTPLPLVATSATQINAQLPTTLAAGRYSVVVRSIDNKSGSNTANLSVVKYAPAVFMDSPGPAIFHKNGGARVSKSNPANRDEPLIIYAAGLGPTTGGKVTTGSPSPSSPLAVTGKVQVYFGDPRIKEAEVIVDWSGLVPGSAGLYQINCRVPGAHIKGANLPVTIKVGGVTSPTTGAMAPTVYVN